MLGKRGYNNLPQPDAKRRRVSGVLGKRKAEVPVQANVKRRRIDKDVVVSQVPQVNITFSGAVPRELHLHFH
jgi:hypothetical protein